MAAAPSPSHEPLIVVESVQTAGMRAMGLLASGRAWLIFLISLAILLQVVLFVAATWGDVLHKRVAVVDPATVVPQENLDPDIAEPAVPAPAENFLQGLWPAAKWQQIMTIALPIAGVAAVAAAMMLVPLMMVGIQVNLVARLPALPATISAFYWSLVTLVLLLPWGRLLGGVFAEKIPWVFSTYTDIDATVTAIGDPAAPQGQIWLRFLVWPVVTLVAAWICGARFGNAYWQVVGLAEMQAKARPESVTPAQR